MHGVFSNKHPPDKTVNWGFAALFCGLHEYLAKKRLPNKGVWGIKYVYWRRQTFLMLPSEVEQSSSSHLASCDSCCIHCGNKLLQCLLCFPLNPDVDSVVRSIWGSLQPKWLTLSYMALTVQAILHLAESEVLQEAPLAPSSSLYLLWYWQSWRMQCSQGSCLSITCCINYSQVITFQ